MSRVSKEAQAAAAAFAGRWRIVEMEMWDTDAIDLEVEGPFTFVKGRRGEGAVHEAADADEV